MLLFSSFAPNETHAQARVLGDILDRMDRNNKTLSSLRADVTMAKQNAQLGGDPEITKGTVIYAPRKGKDALVRIDWIKPDESLAVVDGEYIIYRPRLNQAYTGKVNKAKGNAKANGALAFMNMSRVQLNANYTAAYLGEGTLSEGTKTFHLQLTPKTKTSYKTAELWVDTNGMPLQSKIVENNNDTTTVLLTNLRKNINLKGTDFVINVPGGTKFVKS
ncbi:MAG: LolA family protein [Pyrinomonadaceae bacterium]|nr:outer membrane lipoprotein carrier protein LolA [Blastocatellia bacterium]MDQ3490797.1 outer membrane lipoprotein carrier protein LolA [Acidobacteriota bacterium]